jgi:hypothetical protein
MSRINISWPAGGNVRRAVVTFTMQCPNQVMPGTFRMIGLALMADANRTTGQIAVLSKGATCP